MMNKIFKAIKSFSKAIYNVIDRIIVTPISRLVLLVSRKIKSNSNIIERTLNKQSTLIYLSLIFAVFVFFLVDSKVISLVETEAEVISEQPVKAIYNEEAYVVEGLPETVDITLIGRKSDLYLSKQLGDHEVTIDLSGLGTGEHKVYLSYAQAIDSINYKLDPSYVLVIIKEKISTIKTIGYDLMNQDALDQKLSVGDVTLDRSEVVVKGSKESLEEVATVKAIIDLSNEELKEAGTFTLDNLKLIAYDGNGKALNNIEIVPKNVSAKVTLDSYSSEVPVKIITKGSATVGTAIASIHSNVNKIRIYGDKEMLDKIQHIPIELDIDGLNNDKTFNVTILKPAGIRFMSETTASIEVKVGTESSAEIDNIAVEHKNLGGGYSAGATSIGETNVTVIVKGVKEVLDELVENPTGIKAYVDLSDYGIGTHSVPVIVEGDDPRLQFVSKTKTINIVISAK